MKRKVGRIREKGDEVLKLSLPSNLQWRRGAVRMKRFGIFSASRVRRAASGVRLLSRGRRNQK